MADIASLQELASSLRASLDEATGASWMLDLAQGLVAEQIGEQNPWPVVAKATALAATARAFANPDGVRSEQEGPYGTTYEAAQAGVYLTDDEKARLAEWRARPSATAQAGAGLGFGTIYLTIPGV